MQARAVSGAAKESILLYICVACNRHLLAHLLSGSANPLRNLALFRTRPVPCDVERFQDPTRSLHLSCWLASSFASSSSNMYFGDVFDRASPRIASQIHASQSLYRAW